MGVGTTTLPYDAMRREASVTTNIATTNVGNQDHPLVLGNSLSPTIVDEEVCNVKFSIYLIIIKFPLFKKPKKYFRLHFLHLDS